MSPIRRGPIIEIDSAPEPYHNARTARSTSRARSTGAKANATSEAKIRAKRPKALIGPVIELTDSEPDVTDEEPREAKRRREPSPSNVASPSNATRRKTTPMNDVPLFFPSDNVVRQIFGVDLEGVEGAGGGKGDKGKGRAVVEEDEEIEDGTGIDIECQCCFEEYPFDKMVQCPKAHRFCSTCISTYASTKLSSNDASLICMHTSSCSLPFPPTELRRFLTPTLMSLYERVVQQKEVAEAGLEGLEECPWCEWKCVMETGREQDPLFRCGNWEGGCGAVSCRFCWKKDHLPRSCREVEEDRRLNGRHTIEEAMTAAMMRNCPRCKKSSFIKDEGCNKMTCPNCRASSCYVCRQIIAGYEHFDQNPDQPSTSKAGSKKCLLWDKVEERHAVEVKAAAENALAEYKQLHPDAADEDIKVDFPVVPPPAPALPGANMLHVVLRPGAGSWSAPVGFGVGGGVGGGAQPNPCNLLYNPYVPEPVPAPVPAIAAPPARNVQVAREGRPRRGPNPNPNAGPGPANQRGRIGAPTVAASAPRATRGARGAEANPPPAANAFAFRIDPLAPPPPPPMFGPSRRAVRAAERAADRHAQMEEARAATERMRAEQRARIEAVVARHRQEMAARVAARLEREEMAGGDEGAGGGGAGPAR